MKMNNCASCNTPILDRFLFNVLDQSWHAKCLKCCNCTSKLTEKCFFREGKIYCRECYYKTMMKCANCNEPIQSTDFVRRVFHRAFHIDCFKCTKCTRALQTGQKYIIDEIEGKFHIYCQKDFLNRSHQGMLNGVHEHDDPDLEESMVSPSEGGDLGANDELDSDNEDESLLGLDPLPSLNSLSHGSSHHALSSKSSPMSASSSMSDSGNGCANGSVSLSMGDPSSPTHASGSVGSMANDENQPGGTKRRGPRTTIKAKQLETLKAAFAATPKPTRHIREQLANETGLNMRVIQVWFQNRRSKERRMKQLNSMGSRRNFFRASRRAMRPLRPGMSSDGLEDSPEMVPHHSNGFGYFSDSSNPSEFQFNGPAPPHGPGYFEFYPPGQGPPHLNGEGPPPGLVSPFSNSHPPPPSASAPNMHDGQNMHQGIINLGADAPFISGNVGEAMVTGQSRSSVSPSSSMDGGMSMASMTPDTFVRPNSANSGPPTNPFPTMTETSVW